MQTKNTIYFPGQQADEKIHLVFREHWILPGVRLALWFFLLIIYFAFDYARVTYFPDLIGAEFLPLIDILRVALLMFLTLALFLIFVFYYLNTHIVTNERIVDIEQRGLLHHTISELHLEQIQDVTAEVHGLLPNLLDYGDVYIQTAGETQRFVFNRIPNPTKVTKVILDLYEQLPQQQQIHVHKEGLPEKK